MPGLPKYRGEGQIEEELVDDEEWKDAIRYIHMQPCGPGGVAAADGGFAEKLYNHAIKIASKKPTGFVNFPNDWMRFNLTPG